MTNGNIYKRIARAEAAINAQKSAEIETLQRAYTAACETADADDAAMFARKIRNKMLDESDKQMSIDRLNINTSSATKFIASIAAVFTSDWAKYRQALRDLPQQEGFPFNVSFPTAPDMRGEDEDEQ